MLFEAIYSSDTPLAALPHVGIDCNQISVLMNSLFKGKTAWKLFACVEDDAEDAFRPRENNRNEMSPRFLKHCKGNTEKALKMWQDMLSWREQNNMDDALFRPLPQFRAVKKHWPQALYGHTRDGNLVFYEKIGAIELTQLRKKKISRKDMGQYTAFVQEYIFTRLICNDDGRYMSVLDVKGINWGIVSRDSIDTLRVISETIQNNYPERVSNMLVINAPEWFAGAWKFIERVLAGNIERVSIHLEEETFEALLQYLEASEIPPEYGGTSEYSWGEHPDEVDLCNHVDALNENIPSSEEWMGQNGPGEDSSILESCDLPENDTADGTLDIGNVSWSSLITEHTNENSPSRTMTKNSITWDSLMEVFSPI